MAIGMIATTLLRIVPFGANVHRSPSRAKYGGDLVIRWGR